MTEVKRIKPGDDVSAIKPYIVVAATADTGTSGIAEHGSGFTFYVPYPDDPQSWSHTLDSARDYANRAGIRIVYQLEGPENVPGS